MDEDGSGKMNRIDTHGDKLVVPRWVLMTFKRHRDTLKTVIPAQAGIQDVDRVESISASLKRRSQNPWRCCVTLPYCLYLSAVTRLASAAHLARRTTASGNHARRVL